MSKPLNCIFFLISILLCLACPTASSAQSDAAFLKYLGTNGLQREHHAYLMALKGRMPSDSLHYLFAKYDLDQQKDSLFLTAYTESKMLFVQDTQAFNAACIYFLKSKSADQNFWFNSFDPSLVNATAREIHTTYLASLRPFAADIHQIPEKLQPDFMAYRKAESKKAWVAGTLSAFVPGLGKLYAGRTQSFILTFTGCAVYAVQSYESIRKFGPKNAYSLFTLGAFGVFYVANIYGSIHAVKVKKKETRKQFLIHAADYYHFTSAHNLYP
jgi:hypothetical protein